MFTRTHRNNVVFNHPFLLNGVDRVLPPGKYQVVTDEDLIEELSFPVYRRRSTMMMVPAQSHHASAIEFAVIDPLELQAAQDRDQAHQVGAVQENQSDIRSGALGFDPITNLERISNPDPAMSGQVHRPSSYLRRWWSLLRGNFRALH